MATQEHRWQRGVKAAIRTPCDTHPPAIRHPRYGTWSPAAGWPILLPGREPGCDRLVTIGGVRIEPGDVAVGDLAGVAVVPRTLAPPVLLECEPLFHTENRVREAVRKGMACEKFGVF